MGIIKIMKTDKEGTETELKIPAGVKVFLVACTLLVLALACVAFLGLGAGLAHL